VSGEGCDSLKVEDRMAELTRWLSARSRLGVPAEPSKKGRASLPRPFGPQLKAGN